MSFPAMGAVLSSGLTDPTETHVLLALAYFQNETDGRCFPSTAAIARVSRVSPNFVRRSLKNLEAAGLISSSQRPGCQRSFVLHLDRLPKTKKESESLPVAEPKPITNPKGVTNSQPLTNSEVPPSRIRKGTPNESERSPLTNSLAEQGKEHGIEQGKEQGSIARDAKTPCLDTNPNPAQFEGVPFPDFEEPSDDELFAAELIKADKAKAEPAPEPEAKPKTTRGTRLTIEMLPAEWRTWMTTHFPTYDPDLVFEEFLDYWKGVSGAKGVKLDWFATFRNHVRGMPEWKKKNFLKKGCEQETLPNSTEWTQERRLREGYGWATTY